ncbi:hypothetical protein FOZ62_022381 [Perkinsus olseni]|uniref:Uncharacterized protein n=1 Tax=Perkinsus olseni TaxID=32597 RepID=A0A7J6RIR3_PEROL|nr:hypothetical protein FOZ62_022381 [Perkinsus olseni]
MPESEWNEEMLSELEDEVKSMKELEAATRKNSDERSTRMAHPCVGGPMRAHPDATAAGMDENSTQYHIRLAVDHARDYETDLFTIVRKVPDADLHFFSECYWC